MAYEFNGTNQSLSAVSPIVAPPFTLSGWFKVPNITGTKNLVVIENQSIADNFYAIYMSGAYPSVRVQVGASSGIMALPINVASQTWFHITVIFASTNSRSGYMYGEPLVSLYGTYSPTVNTLSYSSLGPTFYSSSVAEFGIWNISLTDHEVVSLARGISCDKIRPQNLVLHTPLVRNIFDKKNGLNITNNNGATVSSHPRIYT